MPTITAGAGLHTVINVFTVAAGQQEPLLQALAQATERVFSRQPGFVSASFHRGLEGTKVVNYAQWRSAADYQAFLLSPEVRAAMGPIMALRPALDPGSYEVVSVHG